MVRRATLLCCVTLLAAVGCTDEKNEPPAETPGPAPVDPNTLLPFDPLDEDATFTATLRIEDGAGEHPAASLSYAGETYTTDGDGKIEIPNVKVLGQSGITLRAAGYLSRSVVLEYSKTQGEGMRVVLERPGVVREFEASEATSILHNSVQLEFAANSFARADGSAYDGMVRVAASGIDPTVSVIEMTEDGPALRPDFDLARVPQGYGLAADADGGARFVLPESVFTAELTGADGEPLQLQSGSEATYRFKLSAITIRKEGDVLPTYSFDQVQQRWVESGTCTVQGGPDDMLECVGKTDHFSTWMISSGSSTTNPSCGNYVFRVKADSTYETKPVSIRIAEAYGRSGSSLREYGDKGVPPMITSTSGMCFFHDAPYVTMKIHVTLRKVARDDGSPVDETIVFTVEPGGNYPRNAQLSRTGALRNADLTLAKLDENCLGCPPTLIDLDLRNRTPAETVDPCASVTCGSGARCVGEGTCQCPTGQQYADATRGCVTPSCDAPQTWDDTQKICVGVDPCLTNRGGCSADATCAANSDFTAKCTCKAGFSGDGTTCTRISRCLGSPCLHDGTCTDTASGYTCACPTGWTGSNCEVNVNECTTGTAQCDTNATCKDVDGGYMCVCKAGYTGIGKPGECSDIDACVTNPCGLGYTCADSPPPALGNEQGRTCTDVDACVLHPCSSIETCTDLPAPAPNDGEGRTCSPAGQEIDACIGFPCAQDETCADIPSGPNSAEGRTCTPNGGGEVDACVEFPCSPSETCADIQGGPNSPEGRTCTPSGGGDIDACINNPCGLNELCVDLDGDDDTPAGRYCEPTGPGNPEADLTSGGGGALESGIDFENKTRAAEITYAGTGSVFLDAVRVTGLNGQEEVYVRVYNSSGELVASGMNTTVSGDVAEITLTQSWLISLEPLRIAIWTFGGAGTASVYEPASFPYTDSSALFNVTGGYEATGDNHPATASDYIPRITLVYSAL